MMLSKQDVRRFILNIENVNIEKLIKAKEALSEIILTSASTKDEVDLFNAINSEIDRRK